MPLGFCGLICLCPKLHRIDAHSDCVGEKKKKVLKGLKGSKGMVLRYTAIQTGQQLGTTSI